MKKTLSKLMKFEMILLIALIFLGGCSKKSGSGETSATPATPNFTKLSPSCFSPYQSNPILTRDQLLAGSDWNDPSVLKENNQFVMYASSDQNFDLNIAIYRLVSSDGVTWTLNPSAPVLSANSDPSAWDHRAVETPSVVYFNGQYHMFYTGYPTTHTDSKSYKIGHAVSADGITWSKDASYIVAPNDPGNTTPNLTFNQWISAEPAAVVFNNKIYLYFSAVGANSGVGTTLQVIGLTTSADGVTWSTPVSVLEPDQATYPRSTWLGYSTPNAIVLNNEMFLFFDVVQASPWKQLHLHYAKSSDGQTQWTHAAAAIFSNSSFSWTSNEVRSPSVILDGTNLKMWFAGDNGATLAIGYSNCAL